MINSHNHNIWFCSDIAFNEYQKQLSKVSHIEALSLQRKIRDIDEEDEDENDHDESSLPYSIDKQGVARVCINGVLLNKSNWFTQMFEICTYQDITILLERLEQHEYITSVVLDIDSGGGTALGLFTLTDYINSYSKPIKAECSGIACSAAYAIAAATNSISGTFESEFGSIGVILTTFKNDEDVVIYRSTGSEHKNGVDGEAGKQYQVLVDDTAKLFTDRLMKWRGNADTHKGEVFLAQRALDIDLIDNIIDNRGTKMKKTNMDALAQHDFDTAGKVNAEAVDRIRAEFNVEKNLEMERVLKILKVGNVSDEILDAVVNGKNAGDFAIEKLESIKNEKQKKSDANESLKKSIQEDAADVNSVSGGTDDITKPLTRYSSKDYL